MAILMIEDEFLIAAEIRFHLERGGFRQIEHAGTEIDALAAIAASDWDGAILDANLDGHGIERMQRRCRKRAFLLSLSLGMTGRVCLQMLRVFR